mmetsp:Transcript_27545/g.82113  ORF Transcript_27545/g.82113 Transcript_27545/m.82113 type:complete len:288 (-) Transcript_27545:46-909(-)
MLQCVHRHRVAQAHPPQHLTELLRGYGHLPQDNGYVLRALGVEEENLRAPTAARNTQCAPNGVAPDHSGAARGFWHRTTCCASCDGGARRRCCRRRKQPLQLASVDGWCFPPWSQLLEDRVVQGLRRQKLPVQALAEGRRKRRRRLLRGRPARLGLGGHRGRFAWRSLGLRRRRTAALGVRRPQLRGHGAEDDPGFLVDGLLALQRLSRRPRRLGRSRGACGRRLSARQTASGCNRCPPVLEGLQPDSHLRGHARALGALEDVVDLVALYLLQVPQHVLRVEGVSMP